MWRSAPKRARPVTLSWPSGRMVRVPTIACEWSGEVVGVGVMGSASHFRGSGHHRFHDLVVPGAPAEIAREPVADLGLRRLDIALEQRLRGDEDARRADPALQRGVLEELLLERMEGLAVRHALDRLDRAAPRLAAEHEAGADEPAVQHDAAGAAVARGTPFLAARE